MCSSTRAAARYLNDLYAMFRDWNLVLAAYNMGPGHVRDAQQLARRFGYDPNAANPIGREAILAASYKW